MGRRRGMATRPMIDSSSVGNSDVSPCSAMAAADAPEMSRPRRAVLAKP
jgi:hypothetical protein